MNSLKNKMHSHLSLVLHLLAYCSLDILQMCSQLSGLIFNFCRQVRCLMYY